MLIDYVSDLRAPTPTGAAEFAVPVKAEISATLSTAQSRLSNAVNRYFEERRSRLDGLSRGNPNLEQILAKSRLKQDDRIERLQLAFGNMLKNKQNQNAHLEILASLGTAIAVFDAEYKLVFYNQAFVRLWQLEDNWPEEHPSYGAFLHYLRERRLLP